VAKSESFRRGFAGTVADSSNSFSSFPYRQGGWNVADDFLILVFLSWNLLLTYAEEIPFKQLALIDCLSPYPVPPLFRSPTRAPSRTNRPLLFIFIFFLFSKQSDSINQSNPVRGLVLL
jgi:hypothetical protein